MLASGHRALYSVSFMVCSGSCKLRDVEGHCGFARFGPILVELRVCSCPDQDDDEAEVLVLVLLMVVLWWRWR